MSRITVDRWQAAQTAEFGHHQDLRLDDILLQLMLLQNILT